jgi:predicted Zn-dependent peptidase
MLKRLIAVLCWLVLVGQVSLFAQKLTDVVHYTLPNGLKVYLNNDPNMSRVYGVVCTKAGGKTDPHDNTGMAHYLEHMLFKGTEQLGTVNFTEEKPILDSITALYDKLGKTTDPAARKAIQLKINDFSVKSGDYAIANDLDRLLNSIGSEGVNASTNFELTEYHNSFPPHELERWLDIYAHRFEKPVFRLFQSELETVYEEKNRSMDNYQDALLENYLKRFFKKHPYGQQTILGETEHLKNPSLTAMYDYFYKYYVPNNMALILVGPMDVNQVKTWIEQKFGDWKSAPVPKFPNYVEEPFKGREFFEVRLAPIKIGVMGFRMPANGHPDKEKMQVVSQLLNNSGKIGLLDQLNLENKLLSAVNIYFPLNDYGAGGIIFVPKIVGQSLEKAEELVTDRLKALKNGQFSDELLNAVKLNMIKNFEQSLENGFARAYMLMQVFSQDDSWEKYLSYPDRIRAIKKEDVVQVAQQYFGDNCLVMYSKTGFPKKDKLEKPPFKPIPAKEGVKSEYAKKFEQMKSNLPQARFVDFQKDFIKQEIGNNRTLLWTKNELNNIFDLELEFGLGMYQIPELFLMDEYLDKTAPKGMTARAFKEQLYRLGCEYSVSVSDHTTHVYLSGLEENLEKALALLNQLLTNPAADKQAHAMAVDKYKSEIKVETGEPATMGGILESYLRYGKHSYYLRRPSLSQAKSTKPEVLNAKLKSAMEGELTIHYTGKRSADEIKTVLNQTLFPNLPAQRKTDAPQVIPAVTYSEPTILFHNRKDARQSQIHFHVVTDPIAKEDLPMVDYFNNYFGADMSSLVFQEIREYRSLAYSTSGYIAKRARPNFAGIFDAYVGCQGDKTLEAVETMYRLITDMPVKTDRETPLREGLIQKAYSSRPDFRYLTNSVAEWMRWGYTSDPSQEKIPAYRQANFNDIVRFYNKNIKGRTIAISIVGNEKDFDLNALKKYGKIIRVNEKDFYVR